MTRWSLPWAALTIFVAIVALERPATSQATPESASAGVVISEVLFDPKPGDTPFIELLNTGSQSVDVSRMAVRLGAESALSLIRVADPIPSQARLLIRFDGQGRVDGRTLHAPSGVTVSRSGAAELRDDHDDPIDRVAWGEEDGAVAIAGSNVGGTIGRPPGANHPFDLNEWVTYRPASATPGEKNAMPGVDVLVPFDGERLQTPFALEWDPVVGATAYRVQISRDEQFSSRVFDATVSTTEARVDAIGSGQYLWRVQAIGADNETSSFSAANSIEVTGTRPPAPRNLNFFLDWHNAVSVLFQQQARPTPTKQLTVTPITQHKDTKMLQLEQIRRRGKHAWDVDHGDYDRSDPSDKTNCVLASVAMANHFLHGNLSQDRIAYEVRSRNANKYVGWIGSMQSPADAGLFANYSAQLKEKQTGPEWDFAYGDGLYDAQTVAALTFAFSGGPGRTAWMESYLDAKGIWDHVKPEIDSGRPVVGARLNPSGRSAHAFVTTGYGFEPDGKRFLTGIDPTGHDLYIHIDAFLHGSTAGDFNWFFMPRNGSARQQEPEVMMDTDGDGVVDFDETERFHTDPNSMDTDGDGVPDKDDIASGVFDATYGYAAHTASTKGRDFDGDGLPTELDPDSDNGGCKDGVEDRNGDGVHDRDEKWNFDTTDDICGDVNGHLEVHKALFQTSGLHQTANENLIVVVRMAPMTPGEVGDIVDRGSSFLVHTMATQFIENGDCPIFARLSADGAGTFGDPDTSIGGMVYHDDPQGANPGGYRILIDARGSAPGTATVDSCVISGTSRYPGGASTPECPGMPTDDTSRTFVFDCTTKPQPPPDTVITRWSFTGQVTISPPSSVGQLPLPRLGLAQFSPKSRVPSP